MVILHAYLRRGGQVIADLPFRYNKGEDDFIEARELTLDVTDDDTYDSIKQRVVQFLDEEKQESIYAQDDSANQPRRPMEITIT